MGKCIKFPDHSPVGEQLIEMLGQTKDWGSVRDIEGCAERLFNAGALWVPDMEEITEIIRRKRLEISEPKKKPPVKADKPGLYGYTPEMGESMPDCQIVAFRSYYGRHYNLTTPLELRGRGITKTGVAKNLTSRYEFMTGWNEYHVTERAFNLLKEKYTISMEMLLD